MAEQRRDEEGLVYSDNISVSWRPVAHELDQHHLAMVSASNESFLRAVSVIADGVTAKDAGEGGAGLNPDIARLDLKLNLLLDLVGSLVYHELDIPAVSPVRLTAESVHWQGTVPMPGTRILLQLYVQRGLPKPLCCYGEVVSGPADFAAGEATAQFVGLSGAARAWLEKLIFRHHRREVAYHRSRDAE